MEFELQQIGPLHRYRFLGVLQPSDVPRNPAVNKKYFRYINFEIAIEENWAQPDEFEFLEPDDYPIYAYDVYEIIQFVSRFDEEQIDDGDELDDLDLVIAYDLVKI